MITRSGRRPDAAIALTSPEILVRAQYDPVLASAEHDIVNNHDSIVDVEGEDAGSIQHSAELTSAEHDIVHNHDDIVDVEEEASVGVQNLDQNDVAKVKITITATFLEKLLGSIMSCKLTFLHF